MTESPKAPDPSPAPETPAAPAGGEGDPQRTQDEELDEELDETFPASDPLPWRHGN